MGKTNRTINRSISTAALILLLFACSKKTEIPNWLCSEWSTDYDGVNIIETWESHGDTLFGQSIWRWDDTMKVENLKIYEANDQLVYQVSVNKKTTLFHCDNSKTDTLLFVNNKNTFPKRIVYVKPNGKNMNVWIENMPNDPDKIPFPFKKIKG